MTDDETPDKAIVEYDPDDQGTGTVQDNGCLYVGREHGGKDVKWLFEYADDGEDGEDEGE